MAFHISRYQKWIPLGLIGIFLISSLIYVAVSFKPTVDMSVNDGKVLHVRSRSEAEVAVYKTLPYKASFQLTTGESYEMDLRYLGFSYFSKKELKRLDSISQKSFWGKLEPFFDTSQNQLIAVYPQRTFWLASVEETLKDYPHLLRQEPQTNHLVLDHAGVMQVTAPIDGFQVEVSDFVAAAYQVSKTGKFDDVALTSTSIPAEDQSELLSQYPNLVQHLEIPLPDDFVMNHNLQTAFNRMQNIYIASGETLDISALMGELTAESGYKAVEGNKDYGIGTEQLIDTLKEAAFNHMTVLSYKGKFISIGEPGDGLTQLTVENTTDRDMVFSLAMQNGSLSVVLASK